MRVLVSGGGTAGHINPALAIADKIKSENPSAVIEYVGTPGGMETGLVPNAGYTIHTVAVRGFKRKLTLANIDAAVKAFTSVGKAKKIIKNFKPDIVIGTGGYVSWPVVKAAASMGIPTLIHEQNAFPGVTTKMLSKVVDKVMISFDSARKFLDCDEDKLILTGNPVSEKMLKANREDVRRMLGIAPDKIVVLSAGGSLGAKKVNEAVRALVRDYTADNQNIYHFHATGKGGYEEESAFYRSIGFRDMDSETLKKGNVTVKKYIYNMPELVAAADIMVCRAGAMTLSEIAAMGKPAVIIPSPNVTDNHQYKNAKVLADGGGAVLIEEAELTGKRLVEDVKKYAEDTAYRKMTAENVKKFAVTDALDRIYHTVLELVK